MAYYFTLGAFLLCLLVNLPRISCTNISPSHDVSVWGQLTDTWPYRFAVNCAGYLWILLPLGTLVILVKRGVLRNEAIIQNRFIRLLVYGNDTESTIHYAQLPITNADIELPGSSEKHQVNGDPEAAREAFWRDAAQLAFCVFGLLTSYLTWGLLQEKIMTQSYLIEITFFGTSAKHHTALSNGLIQVSPTDQHPDKYAARFRNSQFLVFINRVLAFSVALAVLLYRNRGHLARTFLTSRQPPLYLYSFCSLSNILSSWAQYEALKYVSFPVQILSKGCKMIAVMLMSVCLRKLRYKRIEWTFACCITLGIWLFLLNEEEEKSHHQMDSLEVGSGHGQLVSGILLLALYLTFDSFTSNWQSSLFETYAVSSLTMMAAVNAYSILLTSVSLSSQSEFLAAFRLLAANSALLRDCLILSVTSAIGQLFVYHTIATFGAVVFTLIMTLRQVLAILLSILSFGHTISGAGLLGITIVFGSIFANMWYKYREKVKRSGQKKGLSANKAVV